MPDTTFIKTTKQNQKTVFFMMLPEHMARYHQHVRVESSDNSFLLKRYDNKTLNHQKWKSDFIFQEKNNEC